MEKKILEIAKFQKIAGIIQESEHIKKERELEEEECNECGDQDTFMYDTSIADDETLPSDYLKFKGNAELRPDAVYRKQPLPEKEKQHDIEEYITALEEESKQKGLWHNIRAKRARGEAPAKKGSKAYKSAVKAAKEINKQNESIQEAGEYNETNLDTILDDIQSHVQTSSALDTGFKEYALGELDAIDEAVYSEDWIEALMSLEDLQDSLKQVNRNEYLEVYADMLEKAIRRVEPLADQQDEQDEEDYEIELEEKKEVVEEDMSDINEANVPENIKAFAKRKGVSSLVNKIAGWAEKAGKKIVGGTAIGKNYGTLILDLTHQGGQIRIDLDEEEVTVNDEPVNNYKSFVSALEQQ
jgi:hypothetical protein